jgi:hypothetical protein
LIHTVLFICRQESICVSHSDWQSHSEFVGLFSSADSWSPPGTIGAIAFALSALPLLLNVNGL